MCGHRLRPKQGLIRLASKESRFQESSEARIKMEATHVDAFVVAFRYRGASPLASTIILHFYDENYMWQKPLNCNI